MKLQLIVLMAIITNCTLAEETSLRDLLNVFKSPTVEEPASAGCQMCSKKLQASMQNLMAIISAGAAEESFKDNYCTKKVAEAVLSEISETVAVLSTCDEDIQQTHDLSTHIVTGLSKQLCGETWPAYPRTKKATQKIGASQCEKVGKTTTIDGYIFAPLIGCIGFYQGPGADRIPKCIVATDHCQLGSLFDLKTGRCNHAYLVNPETCKAYE